MGKKFVDRLLFRLMNEKMPVPFCFVTHLA